MMKKGMIFSLVVVMLIQVLGLSAFAQGVILTDVSSHWAKEQVNEAVSLGFITGYPNHTFKPDNNITRAEFTKSLVVALNLNQSSASSVFVDDNNWAEGYIQAAIENGIIKANEYPELKFEPGKKITRLEISVMTVRALDMEDKATNQSWWQQIQSNLTDLLQVSDKWRGYVKIASDLGIVRGYLDGSFGPDKNATRAEAVVMVLRTLDKLDGIEEPLPPVEEEEIADFPQAEFIRMLVEAMGYNEGEHADGIEGHWAQDAYEKAQAAGVLDVVDVDPNGEVTLDDAVNLMMTALGYTSDFYSWGLTFGIITREEYEGSKSVVITEADATRYMEKLIERYEEQHYGEVILQQFVDSLEVKDGVVTGYLPRVKEYYNISLSWTYYDGPSWAESEDREFKRLYSGEPFGRGGVNFEADGTKGHLKIVVTDTRGAIGIIRANIYLPELEIDVLR